MNCYAIISTVDGLSVAHYETLSGAVEDWIAGMKAGPLKDEVIRAKYSKEGVVGHKAALDLVRGWDHDKASGLWEDGEERVVEADIDFAVSQTEYDDIQRDNDRLEDEVRELEQKVPCRKEQDILDALSTGHNRGNKLHECLEVALKHAQERFGHSSIEAGALNGMIASL